MNYDYTLRNDHIDYGVIRGDHKIAFLKTGLGSNPVGNEEKYLQIAHRLNQKYRCTVIVASNPNDGRSHVNSDQQILERYVLENLFPTPEFFFFGNSNGGIKGLELLNHGIPFRKMILVNMPLMINFHKTKQYVSTFPKTSIVAIYGERDASYPYTPFLDGKFENVKVITIPNADHNFEGMLDTFIALSDFLMIV